MGKNRQQKEPINRLKNYYPTESNSPDPLNSKEIKYAKKLLLSGQKEDLDLVDKILFYYWNGTPMAASAGIKNKPIIAVGKYFYLFSEKNRAMWLKHELGHCSHGDMEKQPITRSNYPKLFTLTTALSAGLFSLATNHCAIRHKWLKAALVGWGTTQSLFMACNARQSYNNEYAADMYAALHCPDVTYTKAWIGCFKKLRTDPLFGLTPDELKTFDSKPQLKLLLHLVNRFLPLIELLCYPYPHPSHKNRIKKLEKIIKQMELEEAKKPRIEPTVKLSEKTPDWVKITGTTKQPHEPVVKQEDPVKE